ncbi:MAG: DUF4278 domain-containing protein [Leptolyngbyaceae cyanobacterium RM1_406_9]|nr:DUF4278 domain-containing protein [Leptolyngbyaceae cyanobacterium RM1_406_9]
MSFLFLVPLTVTLGSGFVFKAAKDTSTETATAAFAVGLIGLASTLILSPWEVQLLLVVLLLANVRWVTLLNFLFVRNEVAAPVELGDRNDTTSSDTTASTAATKETDPKATSSEKLVLGKYRGAVCELGHQAEISPHQPTVELQYRGAKVR